MKTSGKTRSMYNCIYYGIPIYNIEIQTTKVLLEHTKFKDAVDQTTFFICVLLQLTTKFSIINMTDMKSFFIDLLTYYF